MEEIWKDIKGFEGKYYISNFGRYKNKTKILKPFITVDGYAKTVLWKNNIPTNCYIHRLVAQAFLPNTDNLPQVNHKDENPLNNIVSNLEWCTSSYNVNYGVRNKKDALTKEKQVIQFDKQNNFIKEWSSTAECGRNGFNNGHISECCNGKRKSHKGYIWRYKDEQ